MKLNKYKWYKSYAIPRPKNMPKSKSSVLRSKI